MPKATWQTASLKVGSRIIYSSEFSSLPTEAKSRKLTFSQSSKRKRVAEVKRMRGRSKRRMKSKGRWGEGEGRGRGGNEKNYENRSTLSLSLSRLVPPLFSCSKLKWILIVSKIYFVEFSVNSNLWARRRSKRVVFSFGRYSKR